MSHNLLRIVSLVTIITGMSGGGLAFAKNQVQHADPAAIIGCENANDMDDFAGFIKPGWQAEAKKLIIASDPQPFRTMVNRNPYKEEINESAWKANIEKVGALIRSERNESYYVPLIINGDITDFGHTGERKAVHAFFRALAPKTGGPLVLAGLGNHDYDQNVDDCDNNKCARDSVCDHINRVRAIPGAKFNVSLLGRGGSDPDTGIVGSMAYSVDIGNMHIVQLNLEPTYQRHFSYWITPGWDIRQHVRVRSALDWLTRDLNQARNENKRIIVNMHKLHLSDQSQLEYFKNTLVNFNVAAVFVGHLHNKLGVDNSAYLGRTPVFYSGGLMAGSYLRVTNHDDRMDVETVAVDGYMQQVSRVKFLDRSVKLYAGLNLTDFICEMPLARDQVSTLDAQNCFEQSGQKAVRSLSVKGARDLRFCLVDTGLANERCFNSPTVDKYDINNIAAVSPPSGVEVYGHGTPSFVVAKLAIMRTGEGLLLEMFKGKNFSGEKCVRAIAVNEIVDFDGDTDSCVGASSANVYGLRNGQRNIPLCATNLDVSQRACYTVQAAAGPYDRLYRISDFNGSPPNQIAKESVGNDLSGKVAKVSFIAARDAELHMFRGEGAVGIPQVLKLQSGGSAQYSLHHQSMKVLNYPGGNLPICLGDNSSPIGPLHICFYGTFKGSFQVPSFKAKEEMVLPAGMHVTKGKHHPEGYKSARISWGDNVRVGLYARGSENPVCDFLLTKNEVGRPPAICGQNYTATKLEVSNYDGYFGVYPARYSRGVPDWYIREEKGDLVVPELEAVPDSPGVYSVEKGAVITSDSAFIAMPPSNVAVELADNSGTLCKFALPPGGVATTQRCKTDNALIPAKTLIAANFNGAQPLCVKTRTGSICFSGDYEGALNLLNLYTPVPLPPGVTAKLTGVMTPPLTGLSYGE